MCARPTLPRARPSPAPVLFPLCNFLCSYDGWLCLMSRNVREPAVLFAMHLMVPDHPGVMR